MKKKKSAAFSDAGVLEADENLEQDADDIPQKDGDVGIDPNKPTKSRKDTGNYEYESSSEEEDENSGNLFSVSLDMGASKKKDDEKAE